MSAVVGLRAGPSADRPSAAGAPAGRGRARGVLVWTAHLWPVVLVLLAWDLWVVLNGYTTAVAPRPGVVIADIVTNPQAYAGDTARTLLTAVLGLVLGMAAGGLAGVAVWASTAAAGLVTPAAIVLRSVPVTAMVPVVARLSGYGDASIPVIVTVVSFFPAFVMTISGLAASSAGTRDVFAALGARRLALLVRLHLPSAVPHLMVAVRITAPSAVLAALLAEYLIGAGGLGHLFAVSTSYLQPVRAWGAALVATVASVALFLAARAAERRVGARMT